MAERRSSLRVPFKRTIRYGEGDANKYGYAYNLSNYGIGIYCDSVLEVGMKMKIEIMLQNEFLKIDGEVIWSLRGPESGAFRAGVTFKEYPDKLRKIYDRIVKTKHAKTFY